MRGTGAVREARAMPTAARSASRPGVLTAALALPLDAVLPRRRRVAGGFPAAAPALAASSAHGFAGAWLATLDLPAGARMPAGVRRASGFPA